MQKRCLIRCLASMPAYSKLHALLTAKERACPTYRKPRPFCKTHRSRLRYCDIPRSAPQGPLEPLFPSCQSPSNPSNYLEALSLPIFHRVMLMSGEFDRFPSWMLESELASSQAHRKNRGREFVVLAFQLSPLGAFSFVFLHQYL